MILITMAMKVTNGSMSFCHLSVGFGTDLKLYPQALQNLALESTSGFPHLGQKFLFFCLAPQ